ncbi:MAG: VWA domain-containing protein [Pyrinomonadaceae bacterium]|nr:VWA domain-containing protein [Pyrinomonadaceae bacterium]
MVRTLLVFSVVFIAFTSAYGQSGRRVVAVPTSTPQVISTDVSDAVPRYSESKPQAPRRNRPPVGFPKLGQSGVANPKTGSKDAPVEVGDDEVLKVETNLITIPVSVFDRNGLYIPGLEQEDFKIFENGKEQEIAYFGTTDKPFTVILLIDTSPSTAYKIEEIQAAATAFVDQLKPQDSVMVIEFASNINVLTEATNDRQKIYKAIRRADWGDGTSLYDAVDFSLRKRLSKIAGRKAIVLFTDGVDTTSMRAGYDSTIDIAEESDAMIFPIYYNTYSGNNGGTGSPLPNINGGVLGNGGGIFNPRGRSAADYQRGRQYLNELAAYTGGRVFRPESTPGGLTTAFEGIAEELRRQYNIGYVPIDEGKPGQRKEIKVRVDRPNLVVRARDSYIVGVATGSAAAEPVKTN